MYSQVTSASKDARTKIHMAIKQNFQNLESSTVELMDSKYVKIVKKSGGGKDFCILVLFVFL